MRDQCAKNPYADECTRVKTQMEDLLRKCNEMATPVQACNDVKQKYCFIWPRELYCIGYSGGGQVCLVLFFFTLLCILVFFLNSIDNKITMEL